MLHFPFLSLFTMKRPNDGFIIVNPNSPKKRRLEKPITHGQLLSFDSTPTTPSGSGSGSGSLDSPRTLHTPDENRAFPNLSSPWVPLAPLRRFKTWHPSTLSPGPELESSPWTRTLNRTVDEPTSCGTVLDKGRADGSSFALSTSPPVVLELLNTPSDLGCAFETSNLRAYDYLDNTPPASQNGWKDCKKKVLGLLSDAGRSPLDLILDILDLRQEEYEMYRSRWFSSTCNKFSAVLDRTFAHPKGHDLILHWLHPHSLELVCSTVAAEMDLVIKELSLPSVEHVSSEFVSTWTLERVVEPATKLCPSLLRILEAAAQTPEAKHKNKIKTPKTVRRTFCH